ncbi:hypothetical protein QFC22_001486 [Naganishia vaughanmartiniae]|uniref:Uncharacterized protein n=1 Tax=Naganishia vaughanmartiniae TaxID=1424756 RepID=A0ACC2XI21_9TREE|nr:hypothetical protein QFC22_001486 [Naganishia vaughanmartiniae]
MGTWWGPKILLYLVLCFLSFLIPNGFFMFYGTYIAPIGSFLFILIGLVLLVDFAHSWSEMCLDRWETSESNLWQFVLVGSTFGMYIAAIALTVILYVFFAGSGCGLNTFFITFNLVLSLLATLLSISPPIQEVNPKSGLAQASMVTAYCTYLTASAVANHNDEGHGVCNPIHRDGTKTTTVLLGALFTFLAIAYSTSRAATQSKALVGKKSTTGAIALPTGEDEEESHAAEENTGHVRLVTNQPKARKDQMRYDAIKAAVDAGSLPASVLDEPESDDEDEQPVGEDRDDERMGTKYNYSWFHIIFIMAAMYVSGLLTDWRIVSTSPTTSGTNDDQDVYIGRSEAAMWMRVVSSWVCIGIYAWSL